MKNSTLYALAVAAALAGCGGGGGGSATPAPAPAATAEVPASASSSVDGFISYLKALLSSDADTLEPVDVSMVSPLVSEEAPPATVD